MDSQIDRTQVERLAHLARLQFTDDEIAGLARDLDSIVRYIDQLGEVETDGIVPTAHAASVTNIFRVDRPGSSLDPEAALANAPSRQETHFKVPKVLNVDGDA